MQLGLSQGELLATVPGGSADHPLGDDGRRGVAAADDLMVVGQAEIGLDNVDLDAATARGVVVMNTP